MFKVMPCFAPYIEPLSESKDMSKNCQHDILVAKVNVSVLGRRLDRDLSVRRKRHACCKVDTFAEMGITDVWLPPCSQSVAPQALCTTCGAGRSAHSLGFGEVDLEASQEILKRSFFPDLAEEGSRSCSHQDHRLTTGFWLFAHGRSILDRTRATCHRSSSTWMALPMARRRVWWDGLKPRNAWWLYNVQFFPNRNLPNIQEAVWRGKTCIHDIHLDFAQLFHFNTRTN